MLETKTVSEIINHLKSKDLSIKEVIEYYLNIIEKLNPKINSIVSIKNKKEIIEEAEKKSNTKFCGLPIAIKDLSDVVGFPTTYGYPWISISRRKTNDIRQIFNCNRKSTKFCITFFFCLFYNFFFIFN